MTMPRALLVDLDGTLARTADLNYSAYSEALQDCGVHIDRPSFDAKAQGRHWREFLPPILAEAGSQADASEVAKRKRQIYAARLGEIAVNRPLLTLLLALRGSMKIALVTSAARPTVDLLLQAQGLREIFDIVITGDDVGQHKPHPEPYQRAAILLDVSPEECLVFEDSDIGVASAEAFGAQVLRVVF
jgi:HAD superfamily hydrolase (TIGR01509 family)